MTGTHTNIVTAIHATGDESSDGDQLPALLAKTTEMFDVREVSGDRAYSTKRNLHAITEAGAEAYIPFKRNSTGGPDTPRFRRPLVEAVALLPVPARGLPDALSRSQ